MICDMIEIEDVLRLREEISEMSLETDYYMNMLSDGKHLVDDVRELFIKEFDTKFRPMLRKYIHDVNIYTIEFVLGRLISLNNISNLMKILFKEVILKVELVQETINGREVSIVKTEDIYMNKYQSLMPRII